ncbi:MAG: energy-coupling factor transporter transmembrane component T [Christensenella sp.]|uniref:energy-coupling factor transporter transmembrane component T family protein n=1 Tax=Christensenella sp. TaxID=1935934 RepID=UPI002B214E3C|nr:energy-coupling factor transporter transmembrane component T [Christensenella sp.]MEA5004411.1 energy-coupling factor transporter transmembrane component T [Christensenella sp.]
MRHIFTIYHPGVIFLYLAAALVCTMLSMQPVYLLISFAAGSIYAVYLRGARKYFSSLKFLLIMFAIVAIVNPLFNHRGLTVLFYLFDEPVTLEAFVYGLCAGLMLLNVFVWFSCYAVLMTNDKFLYLFGKALPTTALMVSMTLKLIPQTTYKARCVMDAQEGMNMRQDKKGQRFKNGVRTATVLMGWSMEDSIETADSMRARGYGAKNRTTFSVFRMGRHDVVSLTVLVILAALSICLIVAFGGAFVYYPYLKGLEANIWVYIPYGILLFYPLILEGKERLAWKRSK